MKPIRLGRLAFLFGLVLGARAGGHPEFSPIPDPPNDALSLWLPLLTVRAGVGYRSNPQFAYVPAGTGFATSGADLFLLRLPTDGNSLTLFFNAEDVRYFRTLRPVTNETGATKEQIFITDLRVGHTFGAATNWVLKFEGRHVYSDQFLNTSSFDTAITNLSSLHAVGHGGTIIPSLAWAGAGGFHAEIAALGTRQLYLNADPETGLSSTWEFGPRLKMGWNSSIAGAWELETGVLHREFDNRVQNSPLGQPLADTRLRQDDLRTDLLWRKDWDSARHWQTTLRSYWVRRRENGEGYTDFDRLGVGSSFRYEAKTWSLRLGGRWSTYDYPRSYVTLGGVLAELRTRTTVQTEAHFEFRLSPKDRVYLEHTWEREQANRTSDRYSAHVATVGVEHDF